MGLQAARPSPDSIRVVRRALSELLGPLPDVSSTSTAPNDSPWSITAPHELFILSLEDVNDAQVIDGARPVGWGFLVRRGERVIASVETARESNSAREIFAQLNHDTGNSIADVFRRIESEEVDETGDFELRLLKVPALYSINAWMHDRSRPEADRIAPVAPVPFGLRSAWIYSKRDFEENLMRLANEARVAAPHVSDGPTNLVALPVLRLVAAARDHLTRPASTDWWPVGGPLRLIARMQTDLPGEVSIQVRVEQSGPPGLVTLELRLHGEESVFLLPIGGARGDVGELSAALSETEAHAAVSPIIRDPALLGPVDEALVDRSVRAALRSVEQDAWRQIAAERPSADPIRRAIVNGLFGR